MKVFLNDQTIVDTGPAAVFRVSQLQIESPDDLWNDLVDIEQCDVLPETDMGAYTKLFL